MIEFPCWYCGDSGLARTVNATPQGPGVKLVTIFACQDCYLEKTKGVIPMVTDSREGCGSGIGDPSPSVENAVRNLEGD